MAPSGSPGSPELLCSLDNSVNTGSVVLQTRKMFVPWDILYTLEEGYTWRPVVFFTYKKRLLGAQGYSLQFTYK